MARGGSFFTGMVLWGLILASALYAFRLIVETRSLRSEMGQSRAILDQVKLELSTLRANIEDGSVGVPRLTTQTASPQLGTTPSSLSTAQLQDERSYPRLPPLDLSPSPLHQPPPFKELTIKQQQQQQREEQQREEQQREEQEKEQQQQQEQQQQRRPEGWRTRDKSSSGKSGGDGSAVAIEAVAEKTRASKGPAAASTAAKPKQQQPRQQLQQQPERKSVRADVKARMQAVGAAFELLDPKDARVTSLNDFPCPETEMHACACQVKCRDTSCSSALETCRQYSPNFNSSAPSSSSLSSKPVCAAVVLAEGNVWATLKRGATPAETLFLSLRDAPTSEAAEAMVSALGDVNPKWGKRMRWGERQRVGEFATTTVRIPLKDTLVGSAAQSIRHLLGYRKPPPPLADPSSSSSSYLRNKVDGDVLCRGGPLQGPYGTSFRSSGRPQLAAAAAATAVGGGGRSSEGDTQPAVAVTATEDGEDDAVRWGAFLQGRIGLVALSTKTPASLAASMGSWQSSGLLDLVGDEVVALLSEPLVAEVALAKHFGFEVVQARDVINGNRSSSGGSSSGNGIRKGISDDDDDETERGVVRQKVRASGANRFTIGSAFYHALKLLTSDYVLFLEKDFNVDDDDDDEGEGDGDSGDTGGDGSGDSGDGSSSSSVKVRLAEELASAAWLLDQGALLVRLRSRKDMGCSGFRTCEGGANKPEWGGQTTRARRRNWLSFYCQDPKEEAQMGASTVADCVGGPSSSQSQQPHFRCFSSRDSNWSLNAVMVHRRAMLHQILRDPQGKKLASGVGAGVRSRSHQVQKLGNWSFGTIARYGESKFDDQAGFERGLLNDDWGRLQVPLCLSMKGVFRHHEVDN